MGARVMGVGLGVTGAGRGSMSVGRREGALQPEYGRRLLGLRKWSRVNGEIPCGCGSERWIWSRRWGENGAFRTKL
jgi:hypothetical protein